MWQSISIRSFVILSATTIALLVYRRCNPTPHATKARDHLHSRSTHAYIPVCRHQDWSAWQLHTSISMYLNNRDQFTTEEQQHLLFARWLVETGKITEWIMDTTEVEI